MRVLYRSLTFWIFVGLFAGVGAGAAFGESIVPIADPLADIFLRLLRMAIMPLIITSVTSAVISVGVKKNLEILGAKTFAYYIITSLLAILTGQTLVNLLKPGIGSTIRLEQEIDAIPAGQQSIPEILVNIISENPFPALAEGQVMPVIFFCILVGYFVTRLDEPHRSHLGSFFHGAFHAMMKLPPLLIWTAPVGVFGINARIVATTGFDAFRSLGFYVGIVLVGLLIHAAVTLPVLVHLVTRRNPFRHYRACRPRW